MPHKTTAALTAFLAIATFATFNQARAQVNQAATEEKPVYFFHSVADLKLTHAPGGLRLRFENAAPEAKSTNFLQVQNVEGLQTISFDVDVRENTGAALVLRVGGRFQDLSYPLTAAQLAPGKRHLELSLKDFGGSYVGKTQRGDEITQFVVVVSGAAAKLDATLANFTLHTDTGDISGLFDASVKPNPFPRSRLYPDALKPFVGARIPRVFMADNSLLAGEDKRMRDIAKLAEDFPKGSFGVDFNTVLTPGNQQAVRFYNALGIPTVFEAHNTFTEYTPYVAYRDFWLRDSSGASGNAPGRGLFPTHGEDGTYPEIVAISKEKIDEVAREGFSEYLFIDYIWPWMGRWGYGPQTVKSFVADLNRADEGLFLRDAKREYSRRTFWDYLRLYTDVKFAPADLGIASWNDYFPATEAQASNGAAAQKKNLFLFNALWHYEYLKYLQKLSDHAATKGLAFYPTVNPEDPLNGTDVYLMALMRGVPKVGYEFFGSPSQTAATYHAARWYADTLQKNGKDFSIIGEIQGGGHGPTRYAWDAAYAFYYDVTSAAKPIDYNNQYIEGNWRETTKSDTYQFPRYAHWQAGALAFLQSHSEYSQLQPAKKTLLIASRGVLEYQPGLLGSFGQTNNLASLLDGLHLPYDAAGKEDLDASAKAATTLIYAPAESSPMHFQSLKNWLAQGRGRTLVTHGAVPFSFSSGAVGLVAGRSADLTWEGKDNWNDSLKSGALSENRALALSLKNVRRGVNLSLKIGDKTVTAKRDLYELSEAPSRVILSSEEGVPLVSRLTRGANALIYIHAQLQLDGASGSDFDREVLRVAMEAAKVKPEASAPPRTAVHLYEVDGGNSAVLWDSKTIAAQEPKNYYERLALNAPGAVKVKAKANREYSLYDFYDDRTKTARADAAGNLSLPMTHSVEIFYFGERADSAFQKTLQSVRVTRGKLQLFEPEAPAPDAVPLAAALQGAPSGAEFLTFRGAMSAVARGKTDGTTATFKYREADSGTWKTLGQRNFDGVYEDDATLYALPLNGARPMQLLVVVSMNGNTSFDQTYLYDLEIVDQNGKPTRVLAPSPQQRGLQLGARYDTDAAQFANSRARFDREGENHRWVTHPAWSGIVAPVYAQFEVKPVAK